MKAYGDELHEAYVRFYNYLGIKEYPISFDTWNALPRDDKAVALYVNFYKTIRLAWFKQYMRKKTIRTMSEGISVILDRFHRIVSEAIISEKMFTDAFIYTCVSKDFGTLIRSLRCRSIEFLTYNVISNIQHDATGKEINLYDLASDSNFTSFDTQFLQFQLDQIYEEETDEIREIIDTALQKGKIPKRLLNKKVNARLKEIFEPIVDEEDLDKIGGL